MLQTIELHPDGIAVATIIVLHGLGADGTDFLPLADEMDLSAIGPVRWLLPRAPVRPVTLNNGYRKRAWYDILGTELERAQGTPREDAAGLREGFAQVHALLDREVARGVPAERIVLAGFSQGCAMTLGAGLRYGQRLAGLAGLSGYLPLARGVGSRDALMALGHRPAWHEYPMEHSVSREEIADLERWLLTVLG